MPIAISSSDKFYSKHGQRCMNFVRAMTVEKQDCPFSPADQLNAATSFLDLSPMYGNDDESSAKLRLLSGGRMKTETRNDRIMMPTMCNRSIFCDIQLPSEICYQAGEIQLKVNIYIAREVYMKNKK